MRTASVTIFLATSLVHSIHAELNWTKKKLFHDPNEACAIADFNNDGFLDISAGRNVFFAPEYVAQPIRQIGEFGADYLMNNGEHAHDVDGDGWKDIISGSFMEKEVYWYRNPGEQGLAFGKLWEKKLLQTTAPENEITFFRDLVGDDTPEFSVNSWNQGNPMLIWQLGSNSEGATLNQITVGGLNGHGIGYGDINGDGREDITFRSGWYERPDGDPTKQPWSLHEDWLHERASCPMIITDVNGDGRNDVIWGAGHDYGLFWMEQLEPTDGKTQWEKHVIDKSWSQAHALAWEDIDNDGQPDLITGKRVRAHSGRDPGAADSPAIYYYTLNKDIAKFTRHTIDTKSAGTGLFIRVADLDENGWKDLVMAGKSGTFVFFNQGN